MTFIQISSAILIGLSAGYVMQGPQICYNKAYRKTVLLRDTTMLRALILAMIIQMVGFHVLVTLGIVKLNIVSGIWLAALVGGFFFGFSFVFAEGCSTSMWYRIGNGNIGALIALIGFIVGEVLTFNGFINPLRTSLATFEITTPDASPATLPNLLGISPWVIVVPLALLGGLWLWHSWRREKTHEKLGRWSWPLTGLMLGTIGIAAWTFSQGAGWDYGLGVVGASGPILRSFWEGFSILNWGSFVLLAMPVGGFAAALRRGELSWKLPTLQSGARRLISGLAMGISASIAGGCNIGHTFTGAPTLALSSLLATVAIFLGATLGNWGLAKGLWLKGKDIN